MSKAQVFISGFVQGVGFRQFIKKSAEEREVKGWVRNLPDGRVEAVLQGEKENIEKLIKLYRKGPFLAEIKNVDVFWQDNQRGKEYFKGFEIIR